MDVTKIQNTIDNLHYWDLRVKTIFILTIADSLDWTDELNHLLLLQEKINSYLAFIESGEVYKAFPKAMSQKIGINVTFKYEISKRGIEFLIYTSNVVKQAGFGFHYKKINSNGG